MTEHFTDFELLILGICAGAILVSLVWTAFGIAAAKINSKKKGDRE